MHWIDRGKEPDRLASIRSRYTPRWVQYYLQGSSERPTDSRWIDFLSEIHGVFYGLCAYCEKRTRGTVDHFQPKSKFPELVYEWSNWVMACYECNQAKGDKWPDNGYVDPCSKDHLERPEMIFDFDTTTGHLRPKENISSQQRDKAWQTINDLKLNDVHHLMSRLNWLTVIKKSLSNNVNENYLVFIASRATMWSSITRAFLNEQGFEIND